jgi:O-antigen ligase
MVVAVVLTRSRMGNTSFFASLLITGLVALIFFRRSTRATVVFIASLVVIDVLIIGSWVGVENVVKRIQDTSIVTQAVGEESVEQRIEPGLKSLAIVKDYPWLGTGAGTFYVVFPKYRPPEVIGFLDHAHNDYAQVAAELGCVGIAAALCAASGLLALGVITLARRGVPQLVRGMAFGGLMVTITLLIHSWFEFNLQIPAVVVAVATVEALLLKAFWHQRAYRRMAATVI